MRVVPGFAQAAGLEGALTTSGDHVPEKRLLKQSASIGFFFLT
jgi:hypothetical protein